MIGNMKSVWASEHGEKWMNHKKVPTYDQWLNSLFMILDAICGYYKMASMDKQLHAR